MRAYSVVERLSWLRAQGCRFGFNVDIVIEKSSKAIPDFAEADGSHAADSTEGRGGAVRTDKSHAEFTDTPIDALVPTALAAYRHHHGSLVVQDPYAGLVDKQPLRVLAALRRRAETDETAIKGWTFFLQSAARQTDKPRLAVVIARRLARIQPDLFANLILPTSYWLDQSAKPLFEVAPDAVRILFDRLVAAIIANSDPVSFGGKSADSVTDWFESSWGSAIGHLAEVLFADPQLLGIALGAGLPSGWTERANALRRLPGKQGSFALAQLARRLDWLYACDPIWADQLIMGGGGGVTVRFVTNRLRIGVGFGGRRVGGGGGGVIKGGRGA